MAIVPLTLDRSARAFRLFIQRTLREFEWKVRPRESRSTVGDNAWVLASQRKSPQGLASTWTAIHAIEQRLRSHQVQALAFRVLLQTRSGIEAMSPTNTLCLRKSPISPAVTVPRWSPTSESRHRTEIFLISSARRAWPGERKEAAHAVAARTPASIGQVTTTSSRRTGISPLRLRVPVLSGRPRNV